MEVSFLSPIAAVVGLAVVIPLVAIVIAERRAGRIRDSLGLHSNGLRSTIPIVAASCLAFGLFAIAAADPVIRIERENATRIDAEVFFVFDVSRSMLATDERGSPTRFERAQAVALELRPSLQDVPAGVASLTDRPLPHLFPSADEDVFRAVVERSIGIERPPPSELDQDQATDFGSLEALATSNFFSPLSAKRLVFLLTDGESRPFDSAALARSLEQEGVELIVLHVWRDTERVFDASGRVEPYLPDSDSRQTVAELASFGSDGQAYAEHNPEGALLAARAFLGDGPQAGASVSEETIAVGAYVALVALIPLALLILRRPYRAALT